MSKHLSAVQFDGITFGMEIETDTVAYRNFKKNIKREKAITWWGAEETVLTVPYLILASVMREAHWLVSELKNFNKFWIEGLYDSEIYVKYTDVLDFRDRFGINVHESQNDAR